MNIKFQKISMIKLKLILMTNIINKNYKIHQKKMQ